MAWSYTRHRFGVCGNFKFEFISLTDIKATRSLIRPSIPNRVMFAASTNTSDNADILIGRTLAWTGTCTSNTPNEIEDSAQTFDPRLSESFVHNLTDTTEPPMARVTYKDADNLYCWKPDRSDVADPCPDGNEDYSIYDERVVQVTAVTANDDGTLFVMG